MTTSIHLTLPSPLLFAAMALIFFGFSFAVAKIGSYFEQPSADDESQIIVGLFFISMAVIGAVITELFHSAAGGLFVSGLLGFGSGLLYAVYGAEPAEESDEDNGEEPEEHVRDTCAKPAA